MTKNLSSSVLQEATIVFLIVALGYSYFTFGPDWNINSRLALVKAFVDEGRLEIDSYHNAELSTNDKSYINGHFYSDKAIGTSIIGIVVYYPIHWIYSSSNTLLPIELFRKWLTFFVVSLPVALIAQVLYILIRSMTLSSIKAFVITLAISLGTPLYKYSTAFYGHSVAALFYFVGFVIWFYARHNKFISLPLAFISSFLLGFMIIVEYPTSILFFCLSLYILYTLYECRQLINWKLYGIMAIGFILPVLIQLFYNNAVFGVPFVSGYSYESNTVFRTAHETQFMGIGFPNLYNFFYQTFEPAFGIFWQSPVLLLSLLGWPFMAKTREYRADAFFTFGAIFLYILFFSGYYAWSGGVAFAPRHIIPILPLFALPLAFIPERISLLLIGSTIVSLFQNLTMAASGFTGLNIYVNGFLKPMWQAHHLLGFKRMLVYVVCWNNLVNGNLTDNRGMELLNLHGFWSLLPLIVLEFILFIIYLKLLSTHVRDFP